MKIPSAQRLCHQTSTLFVAFFLACAALLPATAQAQSATGRITGRVLNEGTGEYLRSATVTVVGTGLTVVSESGGNFSFGNVPAGAQQVQVQYEGLDTKTVPVNVVAGQAASIEVALTSKEYADIVKMGAVVVSSEREGNAKVIMEQKASIEAKQILASDSFGSISEGNVGEFLKYLPGVQIEYTEADARSVSLGGLDSKYTAVMIDGTPVASSGMAAASGASASRGFEFEQISINNIESVELTKTPQPENPGSALAGIVNLRSRGAFDSSGRRINVRAGIAWNSMSGNPFQKQPGWDDEDHYRIQPNFGFNYSDVFLNKRLGIQMGYNYSNTFSEQKAESISYVFDNDPNNNDTEVGRLSGFTFRDSPKNTIRYNTNLRVDYKFTPEFWVSARAEYNHYKGAFFSRDLGFNFGNRTTSGSGTKTIYFNDTINAPDTDGTGRAQPGPVDPNVEYSWSSQTVSNTATAYDYNGKPIASGTPGGSVSVNQGGGATNKYGSTSNFFVGAYFTRGAFRADTVASMSRSMTWYKDRLFGFFWSINPNSLGGLGLRFNRNGPADPSLFITQTAGPDWRNLANYPVGFTATSNDRQGEDQRWQFKEDMQYSTTLKVPTIFKFGLQISQWVNNSDRPISNYAPQFVGADGVAKSADENLSLWAENKYRMQFDYGGNVDGMTNVDRWAVYKAYQANPSVWPYPSDAQIIGYKLQNARDAQEQVDALYEQTVFKIGKFTIAPGVRVEHTRGKAAGPADRGQPESDLKFFGVTSATTGNTGLTTDQITAVRSSADYLIYRYGGARQFAFTDYTTWLRYLHMTYRFNENLVLKGSWNQALARPDMNRMIGGLTITAEDMEDGTVNKASSGNAKLKNETSATANLTLEYYTKGIGQFSVSAYRRDFKNMLRGVTYIIPPGGTWNGAPLPAELSPNDEWWISTYDNVAKTHMSSVEFQWRRTLDFLPHPFNRISMNANYTRLYFDRYENFMAPNGTARNLANLSVVIPYKDFRLRWNINWREGRRINSAGNGWSQYNRENLTHTMDFTWRFNRMLEFYLNARNIFNQDSGTYLMRSDVRNRWVKTGAIWSAGVSADF